MRAELWPSTFLVCLQIMRLKKDLVLLGLNNNFYDYQNRNCNPSVFELKQAFL